MSFTTPLKKARGLGSAHEGAQHWWLQRLSALPLIPLGFWFVFSMIGFSTHHHYPYEIANWISKPSHAWPLAVFLILAFYHGYLGLKVIIEDYVHNKAIKMIILLLIIFGSFLMGGLSLAAIIHILIQG